MPEEAGRGGTAAAGGTLSVLLRELGSEREVLPARRAGPHPGDLVGRFEVVRKVGEGGFGVVLEARDPMLGRPVALKLVRAGRPVDRPGAPGLAEAEAVSRLSHPNIVQLHDAGTSEWGPFLVFELLRGEPLSARLERGPLGVAEAAAMALEVARGLAHAHASGVVHRDLKPSNVFLCADGRVKVLDFGLALVFGRGRQVEGGTPGWMAPEQRRGAPEDERTDVWTLGAILFRALAGRDPASARLAIPELRALEALVERMLEADPVRRPRDAGEVVAALQPLLRGEGPGPITAAARVRRRLPRTVVAAALALLGAVAIAALVAVAGRVRGPGFARSADGRVLTAVADVENHTGEPELDGLAGLLVTSLEQSRALRVLTRSRLVDLAVQAGHPPEVRLDERVGREALRRSGAGVLLVSAIRRFDATYTVELRALEPDADAYLFTLKEQAEGRAAIPGLVDRLSDRARRSLREGDAEIGARRVEVGRAITPDLVAYDHYFRGVAAFEDHDFEGTDRELRAALAADPDMALAHVWMAFGAEFHVLGGERAGPHLERALAARDRLPDKERRLVEAAAESIDGRDATEALERLADDFPQDKTIQYLTSLWVEPGRADRMAYARRALELDPAYPWPLYHMAYAFADTGRSRELLPLAERAVAVRPVAASWFNLARIRGESGDLPGALEAARRAEASGKPRPQVTAMIATVLAAMGRPDEALAELEPWLKPQVPEVSRHLALSARAALAGLAGRRSEALRTAAAASAIRDDWLARTFLAGLHEVGGDPTVARAGLMAWREPDPGRAWRFAWRGLWERADELAPAGAGQTDPPSLRRLRPSSDLLLEALRARRAGRTEEAIRLAEEAVAATPNTTASVVPGVLLAEAGRCGEALPHLDRVAAIFPWPWNQRDAPARIPFALLEGARCAVRLGRPAEARARLDRLLALWVHADADLPELLEARALSARLPR